MELRHLRYFVAVAEALHFGRAAGQLHIAQPSLSHQIRQLETELQTTLLRRTKRRVELTDAGRLLLEEARDILGRADRASMMTRRAGHGDVGTLRIGVGYCMDHRLVGRVVSLFTGRRQATRVELHTMSVPAQFTALRDNQIDVGFVRPPIPDVTLNSDILTREPLLAALPAKHRAARKSVVELSALGKEPFILPPRDLVPVFHDQVLRACRDAGFVPDAPHEADQLQLVLSMVASRQRRGTRSRLCSRQRTIWRRVRGASPIAATVGDCGRVAARQHVAVAAGVHWRGPATWSATSQAAKRALTRPRFLAGPQIAVSKALTEMLENNRNIRTVLNDIAPDAYRRCL